MSARTLVARTFTGAAVTTVLAATGSAAALPETTEAARAEGCFTWGDRDDWYSQTIAKSQGNVVGTADFHAYGEILKVSDFESNGWRVVVDLQICDDGRYVHLGSYDSGPDEGAYDDETHNLEIDEWRKIRFMTCEKQGSDRRYCSGWKYGHA